MTLFPADVTHHQLIPEPDLHPDPLHWNETRDGFQQGHTHYARASTYNGYIGSLLEPNILNIAKSTKLLNQHIIIPFIRILED